MRSHIPKRRAIRNGSILTLERNVGKLRETWRSVWPPFDAGNTHKAGIYASLWERKAILPSILRGEA